MNDAQQLKAEAKAAKQIQKYSADYDQTIVIRATFAMLGSFVGGLFILEGLAQFVWKIQGKSSTGAIYLTPEFIHSIGSYLAGYASAIITALFGKKLADSLNKVTNGNGNHKEN